MYLTIYMIVFFILLSVVALLGVVLAFRYKGIFHKVISIGLLCAALPWLVGKEIIGIAMLLLLAFITSQYALIVRGISIPERIATGTMGLLLMMCLIFRVQHWSGTLELHVGLIVPVLLYLFCIFRQGGAFKKEFSFMLVWMVLSVYELCRYFIQGMLF